MSGRKTANINARDSGKEKRERVICRKRGGGGGEGGGERFCERHL